MGVGVDVLLIFLAAAVLNSLPLSLFFAFLLAMFCLGVWQREKVTDYTLRFCRHPRTKSTLKTFGHVLATIFAWILKALAVIGRYLFSVMAGVVKRDSSDAPDETHQPAEQQPKLKAARKRRSSTRHWYTGDSEPTEKQLDYLGALNYEGPDPLTKQEASVAIDAMLETKNSQVAIKSVKAFRKEHQKHERRKTSERLKSEKDQLAWMAKTGEYAGIKLVKVPGEKLTEEEQLYAGTFVPLEVARRHPELLLFEGLDAEDVLVDDRLRKGTRMVIRPGKFKTIR
jgi:hypothetical protein